MLSRETTRLTERACIYVQSCSSEHEYDRDTRIQRRKKGFTRWERLTSTRDNCRDTQNVEPLDSIFRTWKEKERKQGEIRRE